MCDLWHEVRLRREFILLDEGMIAVRCFRQKRGWPSGAVVWSRARPATEERRK